MLPQSHHTRSLLDSTSCLLLSLASACLLASCKAPSDRRAEAEPSSKTNTSQRKEGKPQIERREIEVRVEGAQAIHDGKKLKIEYPVLRNKNDRIPDWVINPGIGGVTGAVGVASRKSTGTREQLSAARLDARLELAAMLEARVQIAGRNELEENTEGTGERAEQQSHKMGVRVARDTLDMVLAGTRQRALWFDPENGELYVWMVLDGRLGDAVQQHTVDDVSVFVASKPVTKDYRPLRSKPLVPKIYIKHIRSRKQPSKATSCPASRQGAKLAPRPTTNPATRSKPQTKPREESEATPDKSPAQELEETLKPIQAIPSKANIKRKSRR